MDRSILPDKSNDLRLDNAAISRGIVPTMLLSSKVGIVGKKDDGEQKEITMNCRPVHKTKETRSQIMSKRELRIPLVF